MRYRRDYTLFYVKNKKGKKVWYFKVYDPSGTIQVARTTGLFSKEKANRYVSDFLSDINNYNSLFPSNVSYPDDKELTFKSYAKDWWDWDKCPYVVARRNRGTAAKPGIKRSYTDTAKMWNKRYCIPFFGEYELKAITPSLIDVFFGELKNKYTLAPKTINNIRSYLMTMFEEAVKNDILAKNPVKLTLKLIVDRKKRELITIDEAKLLFDRTKIEEYWKNNICLYVVNLLACLTGMREGEIRALRIQDVSPDRIVVQHSYSSKYGLTTTKNSEIRTIPIQTELYKLIRIVYSSKTEESDFIFSLKKGKPIGSAICWKSLYYALEQIGIREAERKERNITFHSWRHFFSTYCVSQNINRDKIRSVTGHKTPEMLEHYTSLSFDDLKEITSHQNELLQNLIVENA